MPTRNPIPPTKRHGSAAQRTPATSADPVGRPINSVAAEIAGGDALTLSEVARQHHTATTTVFRWVQRGLADGTGALDRMQSFLMRGVLRSEEVRQQLGEIGLNFEQLRELGPTDRLARIRKGLGRVRNAARRATLQTAIFGQDGADLNLDGGRIFLEAVRRGKIWVTSAAAVRRFFERLECWGPRLRQRYARRPSSTATAPVPSRSSETSA